MKGVGDILSKAKDKKDTFTHELRSPAGDPIITEHKIENIMAQVRGELTLTPNAEAPKHLKIFYDNYKLEKLKKNLDLNID